MDNHVEVHFGQWIDEGFKIYKANFATLVLAALILVALSSVTMMILLPPLTAGFILLTLRIIDGESPPPGPGTVFSGFSVFINALVFMLIWFVVMSLGSMLLGWFPIIGPVASLFFCYALETLLVFALFLIADRQMGFWEASTLSMDVVKTNFWSFFGLTVVASVIGGIGSLAFVIGVVLTLPIGFCIIAVAYRAVLGTETSVVEDQLNTTP